MGQQGLVFDGQMIRLEDGREVALSVLIEDARRRRGAEIRRLFFAGVAAVRRLLGRAEQRPRCAGRVRLPSAPDWPSQPRPPTGPTRRWAILPTHRWRRMPRSRRRAIAAERAPDQLAA